MGFPATTLAALRQSKSPNRVMCSVRGRRDSLVACGGVGLAEDDVPDGVASVRDELVEPLIV
jgi:hypothetical protein